MVSGARKGRLLGRLAVIWGWNCWWCRVRLDADTVTIEHLVPLSRGGTWAIGNLRLACVSCNSLRADSELPPVTCRWTTPPRPVGEDPLFARPLTPTHPPSTAPVLQLPHRLPAPPTRPLPSPTVTDPTPCPLPTCGQGGGFHDRAAHAAVPVPAELAYRPVPAEHGEVWTRPDGELLPHLREDAIAARRRRPAEAS